ncbi:unnamed protein product [Lampetra planeri]
MTGNVKRFEWRGSASWHAALVASGHVGLGTSSRRARLRRRQAKAKSCACTAFRRDAAKHLEPWESARSVEHHGARSSTCRARMPRRRMSARSEADPGCSWLLLASPFASTADITTDVRRDRESNSGPAGALTAAPPLLSRTRSFKRRRFKGPGGIGVSAAGVGDAGGGGAAGGLRWKGVWMGNDRATTSARCSTPAAAPTLPQTRERALLLPPPPPLLLLRLSPAPAATRDPRAVPEWRGRPRAALLRQTKQCPCSLCTAPASDAPRVCRAFECESPGS